MKRMKSVSVCVDMLRIFFVWITVVSLSGGMYGCVDKKPYEVNVTEIVGFTDRLGQAKVTLYSYEGDVEIESIKEYAEKLPCRMNYAYFYPDTVALEEIPVEALRTAKTFTEAQDILFNGEGFANWRFAARCYSLIPVVTDCLESKVNQDCR